MEESLSESPSKSIWFLPEVDILELIKENRKILGLLKHNPKGGKL